MFRNTKMNILNMGLQTVGTTMCDIQPYINTYHYDNGYKIELSHKIFCDRTPDIDEYSYLEYDGVKYKIIKFLTFSDYMLCYCYECEVI